MKRLLCLSSFFALLFSIFFVGCANIGRESAITALQTGTRANDAQVANLAQIAHALNQANGQNRLRAGDDPARIVAGVVAVDKDIEQERVSHADVNRVFDYADIYLQSQRWGGEVLLRQARQAATTQPAR